MDALSRHRPLALLAGVVLAQVLLLAFQIKRDHDVRLIRYWAVQLMTPVQRSGTWSFSKVSGVWTGYIGLHNARVENEQLHAELNRLQLRNRELENDAAEADRLRGLLNFRQGHPETPMIAAQVIGASADPASHNLFLNRGERDHIRRNMAVITPEGIVGKVVEVFPSSAQVLLLNDKDSGVGALFADSRTHGVVKGTGDPEPRMDYVVDDEKVHDGQVILTSGEDRIFPKGLLIGTVSSEKPGSPFQVIRVKAGARLDQLEDVLVLLSQQELTPNKESDGATSVIPPPVAAPRSIAVVNAQASGATKGAAASPASASSTKPGGAPATAAQTPAPQSAKPAVSH